MTEPVMTTVSVRINGLPREWRQMYRKLRQEDGFTRVEAQVTLLFAMVGLGEIVDVVAPARRLPEQPER